MRPLLSLLFAASTSATGTTRVSGGYADCPCIDPYPVSGPGTNATGCAGVMRAGVCYGLDYGSRGCRAYDAAVADACQTNNPPQWCFNRWCYVAGWNCLKPHHNSRFFPGVLMANASLLAEAPGVERTSGADISVDENVDIAELSRLSYSYETCGIVDHFTYADGFSALSTDLSARGPLRITIPGDEPPYIVTLANNTVAHVLGTSHRDGSIVRYVTDVIESLGLTWVELPITPESRAAHSSSSFTACAHDVALNNTDICVGSVWAFEFRRRLTAFSAAIEPANLHLIVKKQPQTSLIGLIGRPFAPFSPLMWFGLFAAMMYAGYAIYTLNATGFEDGALSYCIQARDGIDEPLASDHPLRAPDRIVGRGRRRQAHRRDGTHHQGLVQ